MCMLLVANERHRKPYGNVRLAKVNETYAHITHYIQVVIHLGITY